MPKYASTPNTPIPAPEPIVFEPEFVAGVKQIFEENIVFNRVLGLKITSVLPDEVQGRIDMRPELIGHYSHNRVHGGVISAALDAMGGLAVMAFLAADGKLLATGAAAYIVS